MPRQRDETGGSEAISGDGRGLSVLLNGISVLQVFSLDEPLLGVTEIAAKVGLHKSTVSRILATLERVQLVERDSDSRRFRLGLGVIALAGPLLADLDVRRVAYPVLQTLSERTGETSALMVWNGTEAVCVEQVPSHHQVKHTTPLGTRYRTMNDSSVRVFLAHSDPARALTVLRAGDITGAQYLDDAGIEAYFARLSTARERGYTANYGETSLDEVGIASAVFDHRGDIIAAVLVSAPRFRVSEQQVPLLGEAVRDCADRVSERLGGRRSPRAAAGI